MSQGDSDQCTGCSQPSTTPYKPNPTVYAEGDICAIRETTRTPVYLLLTNKRPPSQSSANISQTRSKSRRWLPRLSKSRSSLTPANLELDSFQWNSKASPRPGIVLSEVEISSAQGSDTVMVCLLTTFNETADRDKLPLVLRHFSFPVSPHRLAGLGDAHAHTTPKWQKEDAWIIAIPFPSTFERISGRWMDHREEARPDGSFALSEDDQIVLMTMCAEKRVDWDRQCVDNTRLADDSLEEYDKSLSDAIASKNARRNSTQGKDAGPSRSSFGSRSGSGQRLTLSRASNPTGTPSSSRQSFGLQMDSFFPKLMDKLKNAGMAIRAPIQGVQLDTLPEGVSTESLGGDIQVATPTQSVRASSLSVVDQSTSSERNSTAESAGSKSLRAVRKLLRKVPYGIGKSRGSNSSIAGASEGSGGTKEK